MPHIFALLTKNVIGKLDNLHRQKLKVDCNQNLEKTLNHVFTTLINRRDESFIPEVNDFMLFSYLLLLIFLIMYLIVRAFLRRVS